MGLYDFSCDVCAIEFEEWTTVANFENISCPKCGLKVRRNIKTPRYNTGMTKNIIPDNAKDQVKDDYYYKHNPNQGELDV